MSEVDHQQSVSEAITEYGVGAGIKFYGEKSVGFQVGTRKGKWIPSNSVVERWIEGPIKMLGVWFGPDREELSKLTITCLTQT